MEFSNVYADAKRAEAYAKLEFPGTYHLAYRDLPEIIFEHVKGRTAMDFGCGTGRSTRFLQKLGFNAVGVDISEDMIRKAREINPKGDYRLIREGDLSQFKDNTYDLVLSAFTFDNIPTMKKKVKILQEIRRLLKTEGIMINLVSSPEIYTHEWASFSTKDFPQNKQAKSGDKVKIIVTELEDKKPVEDIIWTHEHYKKTYKKAGLELIKTHKSLAKQNEPYKWVNETRIAPWVAYVLKKPVYLKSSKTNNTNKTHDNSSLKKPSTSRTQRNWKQQKRRKPRKKTQSHFTIAYLTKLNGLE